MYPMAARFELMQYSDNNRKGKCAGRRGHCELGMNGRPGLLLRHNYRCLVAKAFNKEWDKHLEVGFAMAPVVAGICGVRTGVILC